MTIESSLLLEIMCSPLAAKSMQFMRSVFSRNTFATRKERKTSSVSFILIAHLVKILMSDSCKISSSSLKLARSCARTGAEIFQDGVVFVLGRQAQGVLTPLSREHCAYYAAESGKLLSIVSGKNVWGWRVRIFTSPFGAVSSRVASGLVVVVFGTWNTRGMVAFILPLRTRKL